MTTTDESHCRFQDDLNAYVDRALDEARRRALELHLSSCHECRRELEALATVDRIVRTHVPEIEPSPSFESAFLRAFEAEIEAESSPILRPEPRPVVAKGGFWRWLARPVLIPMSAAAVAGAVALISWPQGTAEEGVARVVDRSVDPRAVEKAVAIRPAVAVDPHPTTSLASDADLPRAIEEVVQEMDGRAKPVDAEIADALEVPRVR